MNKVVSLYYKDLLGDKIIAQEEHHKHRSASMIKIPIMLCALEELDLNKRVRIKEENKVPFSVVDERDILYSYEELISWMIMISCNTATNELIDALGYEKINAYIKKIGAENTHCSRKMMDLEAYEKGFDNVTTAYDMGLFLEEVLKDERAMSIMKRGRHFDGIQRYIADDILVMKKSGSLDLVQHDGGIFDLEDRRYLLVVMTSGYDDKEAARMIGEKSLAVYEERYESVC